MRLRNDARRWPFRRELRNRQTIVVESRVESYTGKMGTVSQKILRDGQTVCDAKFIMALLDMRERKLITPTPEWLKAVGVSADRWIPSAAPSG